jgi:hypothetical protein
MGIHTFADALHLSDVDWRRKSEEHGANSHQLVRGIDGSGQAVLFSCRRDVPRVSIGVTFLS